MMKTLVLGASSNSNRYSFLATELLKKHGHQVIAIGSREGMIGDTSIVLGQPILEDIHTITMYLSAARQELMIDYILSLKPKRIIFNPGSENEILMSRAINMGIECIEGCTLVMLHSGQY